MCYCGLHTLSSTFIACPTLPLLSPPWRGGQAQQRGIPRRASIPGRAQVRDAHEPGSAARGHAVPQQRVHQRAAVQAIRHAGRQAGKGRRAGQALQRVLSLLYALHSTQLACRAHVAAICMTSWKAVCKGSGTLPPGWRAARRRPGPAKVKKVGLRGPSQPTPLWNVSAAREAPCCGCWGRRPDRVCTAKIRLGIGPARSHAAEQCHANPDLQRSDETPHN